jgi:8-oxo-dGTP pyrophosphatase MutT (NUDIX family)
MQSRLLAWVGQFAVGPLGMAAKAFLSPVALGAQALLVDKAGRIGLVRHSYMAGLLLPGGGVKRGEPAEQAIMRELREELGEIRADPPTLFGLYTRRSGWATNVIALYVVKNAEVEFRKSLEVRELVFIDPAAPPEAVTWGTLRRIHEYCGGAPISPHW